MPVYNGLDWIGEAIQSVFAQQLDGASLELVVVDDGSTDGTAELVAAWQTNHPNLRYYTQLNQGPSAARNLGLEQARGEIIGFLDADDLWLETTLANLLTPLQREGAIAIVHGQLQDLWLSGITDTQLVFERLTEPRRSFNLGSALFRRSVFDQVGNFDPALRQGEDVDFWMRVQEARLNIHRIEAVTLIYRRHPACWLNEQELHRQGLLRALKRSRGRRSQT